MYISKAKCMKSEILKRKEQVFLNIEKISVVNFTVINQQ